ncbi:MAG TPA: TrmH family RNA methyltransferase [Bryobacteraceae bacterium]|nr:TrmH family RNA methyltransferase [Bryobacteraceae bacterium]
MPPAPGVPGGNLRVVLVAPRNPLNIGAAARAMSNFGFLELGLVNAYDVAFREARSAVGAGAVVRNAVEYPDIGAAVADCSLVVGTTSIGNRQLQHPLRRLEYGGRLVRRALAGEKVALLFGSEKFGLSNEDMSWCHWLIRIPTREEHGSMNLGQAVAVCLYELARRPVAATPEPRKPARSAEVDRITRYLLEALRESGYPRTQSTAARVRRMVRRLNIHEQEAEAWMGMLRQIVWKLRSGDNET